MAYSMAYLQYNMDSVVCLTILKLNKSFIYLDFARVNLNLSSVKALVEPTLVI